MLIQQQVVWVVLIIYIYLMIVESYMDSVLISALINMVPMMLIFAYVL